ncbi:MAG TPA: hypothetical protein VI815_02350 [Candidatus Nanoarchaeia archaeon]|nr:hypothetical protein [Candidatus Nanoarchaeia archaeon]
MKAVIKISEDELMSRSDCVKETRENIDKIDEILAHKGPIRIDGFKIRLANDQDIDDQTTITLSDAFIEDILSKTVLVDSLLKLKKQYQEVIVGELTFPILDNSLMKNLLNIRSYIIEYNNLESEYKVIDRIYLPSALQGIQELIDKLEVKDENL